MEAGGGEFFRMFWCEEEQEEQGEQKQEKQFWYRPNLITWKQTINQIDKELK